MSIKSNFSSYSVASQVKVTEQKKEIENLKRLLLESQRSHGTSLRSEPGPSGYQNNRKRHSSQQLGGNQKDSRISPKSSQQNNRFSNNRFEALASTDSEMDGDFESDQQTQVSHVDVSDVIEKGQILPIYDIHNNGGMRQEIEVNLETLNGNGNPFRGTITRQEAKHHIFKESLGFVDFSNFDGVRFTWKNMPVVVFKLKTAINVDELLPVQFFQFKRKSSRQGKTHVDVIGCKIRGLRNPVDTSGPRQTRTFDDGSRLLKIDGCEYRVKENQLSQFLSFFGEATSIITEDLFDDGSDPDVEKDGTNRTGTYSVRMKLKVPVPQLLPIMGKRIKIHYPGIQKLCTNCFGNHPRQFCKSVKVQWMSYVESFHKKYPEIPSELYGRWLASESSDPLIKKTQSSTPVIPVVTSPPPASIPVEAATSKWVSRLQPDQAVSNNPSQPSQPPNLTPTRESFRVPRDAIEHKEMVARLVTGGSLLSEAESIIAARKTAFNKANREFKKNKSTLVKGNLKKPSKQSKNVYKKSTDHGV